MFFHSKKIVLPVDITEIKKELAKADSGKFQVRFVATGKYEVVAAYSFWVFTNNNDEPYYPITTFLSITGDDGKTSMRFRAYVRVEVLILLVALFVVGYFLWLNSPVDTILVFLGIAPVALLLLQDVYFKQERRLNLDVCNYFINKYSE
ncbi:MAG: hypothetical protein ACLGH8_16600 [Bacteroidia bacterium]